MNSSLSAHSIPDLPNILVDGFRHRLTCSPAFYILTHFHSDHYGGLNSRFDRGTILCTPITKSLICSLLQVPSEHVRTVDYNESVDILGTKVTFLDAHHCPGAALLLFELANGNNYLHTGDMRYHPQMKTYPPLKGLAIDRLYLDTTYAHPRHTFLSQQEAIHRVSESTREFLAVHPEGVVLLCAYNLGKEKLMLAVLDGIVTTVFVDEEKMRVLGCLGALTREHIDSGRFVTARAASRFHICKMGAAGSVMPYFRPNFDLLRDYLSSLVGEHGMHVTRLLCIVPTGWAANSDYNRRNSLIEEDNVAVQLIPYSEHSNYLELKEFVRFLKPREVVPTVFKDVQSTAFIAFAVICFRMTTESECWIFFGMM